MIRFFEKIAKLCLVFVVLGMAAYLFILPRVLPREYRAEVSYYANYYDLEESLVYAVIYCESGFDKDARSRAGAMGLMQVTQETGWWAADQIDYLDADNLDMFDPDTNIALGCWYLMWLDARFDEQSTVLAAYNAGHGNAAKWLADENMSQDGRTIDEIPFGETRNYVKKVDFIQKLYKLFYSM